jgi:hypothetical protein
MWYAILFVVGVILGAVAFYLVKAKEMFDQMDQCYEDLKAAKSKYLSFIHATEAAHHAAFAPYGAPEQIATEAFNKLWSLAGLEELGKP